MDRYSSLSLFGDLRQKTIILIIKSFGLIGIDLLQLSERITNHLSNRFFSRLEDANSNYKSRRIIMKSFSKLIDKDSLENITLIYDLRMIRFDISRIHFKTNFISRISNLNLDVKGYLRLSKLLSRLGYFSAANEIEEIIAEYILNHEFTSIYSLFLKIKVTMYYDFENLNIFLKGLGLNKHLIKFLKIDKLTDHLVNQNNNSNKNSFLVLGPLRDSNKIDEIYENIAILKPSKKEINSITNLLKGKYYLYTSLPLICESKYHDNIINVVDSFPTEDRYNYKHNVALIGDYINLYLYNGFPMHLQRLLLHQIFELNQKKFSIEYFTFYLSDKLYSDNYMDNRFNNHISSTNIELNTFIWRIGWHDLLANFRILKLLYDLKILSSNSDDIDSKLKLSVKEYAIRLEKRYNINS